MTYLHVTPVVGLPQVNGWSQVAENAHTSPNRLICAFAVEGSQAGNLGRDISEEIAQFTPTSFENAYEFFEKLIDRFQEYSDNRLYMAAGIFIGSESAYAAYGGSVFLRREGKIGTILHCPSELKLVIGKHFPEDTVVLTTLPASKFLSEIELKFKTGFDTDTIITSIVPGVHGQADSSLSAMAFVVSGERLPVEEKEDSVFFEADIELDGDKTVESAQVESAEPTQPEVETPPVAPENIAPPSPEVLTELGLDKQVEPPKEQNPLVKKGLSLLKKFAFLLWRLIKVLGRQLYRLMRFVWQRLISIRPADLHPRSMATALSRNLGSKSVYIGTSPLKKRLKIGLFLLVLLLVLAGGVFAYRNYQNRQRALIETELQPFAEILANAQVQVNDNPVAARDAVAQVISQLEVLHEQEKTAGNSLRAAAISKQLEEARALHTAISGREELSELPIYYDMRLVDADFLTTVAGAGNGMMAALDVEQKQLIILNLAQKQPTLVDLQQLDNPRSLKVRESDILVLANGIRSVPLGRGDTTELIAEGDSNRDAQLLGAYDRFVYALNPAKRNIYRYASTDNGFSDPIGWMQAALGLDYQQISSWAIDGEIWIGTNDGQIHRFASGRPAEFAIKGLPEPFSTRLYLATDENQEHLYVLEPERSRLVILSKNGDFIREVKSGSLASAGTVFVDEGMNKAFAVSGSIIFEISL